ncbi:DUF4350 domain-containing protein [Dysgonomonas sp. ZJ279]|uniref:DUF4350 domain-containing protein n=1 Tax=Dysgonomonas sp. ZJ279 TaxID=2709796 RepID=UPI0013EAB194|nr:DUF4350 domain-containing protein [Dysgonomonas sp. ZJ279]
MKDKKWIALIAVIVVMLVGLIYLNSSKKKEISWVPTFYNTDTNPYGTYISYELLKTVFPDNKIRSTRKPIYNNLKDTLNSYFFYDDYSDYEFEENDSSYNNNEYTYDNNNETSYSDPENIAKDDAIATTASNVTDNTTYDPMSMYDGIEIPDTTAYIFVNKDFTLDKVDLEYLLDFVGMGNNVFISSESFSRLLMDTLTIKEEKTYFDSDSIYTLVDYPNEEYAFTNAYSDTYFNTDSCKLAVRALGQNKKGQSVFLQVKYGNGYFYLHSVPMAFTNLNILNLDKYDFAFRSLSYMPRSSKVIWDEYQKQGALGEQSMFRVILSSIPLTIALCISLLDFLLFMIFRAKRTQRIIPIINPPVNSSIEFLDTISNLYYRKKDFHAIAEKRQAYFLDYIRKNYYMSTEYIDSEFIQLLSTKSGAEKDTLNDIFAYYKDISTLYDVPNDMFLKYNSLLEDFYRTVKNK